MLSFQYVFSDIERSDEMILSVSRRTDIPNYYSEWFFNRINEGFLYVRNPMNFHQISEIKISPDVVDCIVFWTKNPLPMMRRLDELKENDIIKIHYQNKDYFYQVTSIWEEDKTGYIHINKKKEKQLILTTCSPKHEGKQLIVNSILI